MANARASNYMRCAGANSVVTALTQSSQVAGAFTVISDPLERGVASCVSVRHQDCWTTTAARGLLLRLEPARVSI